MSYLFNAHPLLLLLLIPVWAFFFRLASSLIVGEVPTWRRACINVLLSGGLAFLLYDLSGYAFLNMFGERFVEIPEGYSYRNWFAESLLLKWEVLGLVPGIRYLPFVFALCAGGTIQVLTLIIPFRLGVLLFIAQWGANLALLALAGFVQVVALGPSPVATSELRLKAHPDFDSETLKGIMVSQMPTVEFDARGNPIITRGKAKDLPIKKAPDAKNLDKAPDGPSGDAGLAFLRPLDPYLEPIKVRTAPLLGRFPALERMLNLGGWWVILAGISVLALCWGVDIARRAKPLGPWLARDFRASPAVFSGQAPTDEPPADELTGPALLTVHGLPARIHTVVVARASMEGERVDSDLVYLALDALQPKLGALAAAGNPNMRRWGRQLSTAAFARAFFHRCQPTDAEGQPSHWILVVGTITLGRQRFHVGLVVRTAKKSTIHRTLVENEKWPDVLRIIER